MSQSRDSDGAPAALAAVPRHLAFIGMGGNLGDVTAHLRSALAAMHALPGTTVEAVSGLYRTRPVESSGPDYLNAVAALRSALGPRELLGALHGIEALHERERPYQNAPRTLDLDLLWYGAAQRCAASHANGLVLPHPRMTQRAFVLLPLVEVMDRLGTPGVIPVPDKAARQALADEQGIEPAGQLDWSE